MCVSATQLPVVSTLNSSGRGALTAAYFAALVVLGLTIGSLTQLWGALLIGTIGLGFLLAALAVLGLMIGISRRVPRPRADMRLL